MKQFFKSFLAAFLCASSFIFAIHNYTQYAAAFDRVEEAIRVNKAYADYLPVLQKRLSDAGL